MALNFQTVSLKNLANGIEQKAAPNAIGEAFAEDIQNADTNAKGFLTKRKGYQGQYGYLPFRVTKITSDGGGETDYKLFFDGSVSLAAFDDRPIVVYGLLSEEQTGEFTDSNDSHYFTDAAVDFDSTVTLAAAASSYTVTQSDHGLSTYKLLIGVLESSGTTVSKMFVDSIAVNDTTYDIALGYSTAVDVSANILIADRSTNSDSVYSAEFASGEMTEVSAGVTYSLAITQAAHALDNTQIIPMIYEDLGATRSYILPDEFKIEPTGDITATFSKAAAFDGNVVLSTTTSVETISGSTGSNTVVISNPGGSYFFTACYWVDGSNNRYQVIPDSITYDSSTDELTVVVILPSNTTLYVYYAPASPLSNSIIVTGAANAGNSYSDSAAQLTVWGISHNGAYSTTAGDYAGHTTHIDNYKSISEERLLCGLGGNLFSGQTRSEAGTTYLIPSSVVELQEAVASEALIAPTFQTTASGVSRTASIVESDEVASNLAVVESVSYVSATQMKYVLTLTNKVGTLAAAIVAGDELIVSGMDYAINNGTFAVVSVSDVDDSITVTNTAADAALVETSADGTAGIFTDRVTLAANSPFVAGDTLTTAILSAVGSTVVGSSTTTLIIRGITSAITVPVGTSIEVTRSTSTIPITSSVNFVYGDMCTLTGIDRELRVTSVDTTNHTLTVDETLSVTHGSDIGVTGRWIPVEAPTSNDNIIRHLDAQQYDEQSILRSTVVADNMYFTNYDDEVYKYDGTSVYRAGLFRWQPQLFVSVNTTVPSISASPVRTEVAADESDTVVASDSGGSILLTTGSAAHTLSINDKVVFATTASDLPSGLSTHTVYYVVSAGFSKSAGTFQVSTVPGGTAVAWVDAGTGTHTFYGFVSEVEVDSNGGFVIGDIVSSKTEGYYSKSSGRHEVTAVRTDSTNGKYYITTSPEMIPVVDDVIRKIRRLRYYFRLQAIDVNDNIVASATTGQDDYYVDLTDSSARIQLKLVGMPAWDAYDYDRLEVRVFRADVTDNEFRLVSIQLLSFDVNAGYMAFFDRLDTGTTLDTVNTILSKSELGTAWTNPLRAKYLTSLDNRLVIGNVKDYPEIALEYVSDPVMTAANMNTHTLLFKRDSDDTGTSTNMTDRVVYEFVTGGDVDAIGGFLHHVTFADGDVTVGTDSIAIADHNMVDGERVTLSSNGTLPAGLATATTYYIVSATSGAFKLSLTSGGDAVDITAAAGGGTHTATKLDSVRVNEPGHSYSVGDWVYFFHKAAIPYPADSNNDLSLVGWYQLSSVSTNFFAVISVDHGNHTPVAEIADRYVFATTKTDVPVWLGEDYSYGYVQGHEPVYDSAGTQDWSYHSISRLANAINCTMRMTNSNLSGQSDFKPWLVASAGSEIGVGKIQIRQPKVEATTFSATVGSAPTDVLIYNKGSQLSSASVATASSRLFPSRVVVSYKNFAEIFNGPYGLASDFTQVIDVNTSDGQEITGIIPFFAESVFGGGQKESTLVVFKESSVYLVDVTNGSISKLETHGQGCTAPYSIASTRNGVIFANSSGIYRLNRDLSISYLGSSVERIWQDTVNTASLSRATGHHYAVDRKYKLSVPVSAATVNSRVLVYDHEKELDRRNPYGSWVQYTNHAATGWCNQGADAFFGVTYGEVFKVRNNGEAEDYRDDASAVDTMSILLRPMDFGLAGTRKAFRSVTAHFHLRHNSLSSLTALAAMDYSNTFSSMGSTAITEGSESVKSLQYALPKRRGEAIQLKFTDNTIDQSIILSGVDISVAAVSGKGITDRESST